MSVNQSSAEVLHNQYAIVSIISLLFRYVTFF